jgi:hypothetical protein
MASPAKAAKPAPSPAEIDLKAIEYKDLEKKLQDAKGGRADRGQAKLGVRE